MLRVRDSVFATSLDYASLHSGRVKVARSNAIILGDIVRFSKYVYASLFLLAQCSALANSGNLAQTVATPNTAVAAYRDFVIIIPSYNNQRWCRDNLLSALNQDYPLEHFRIIYVNDCSTDLTGVVASETVRLHHNQALVTLINNPERRGALRNFYDVITNLCRPSEIVVTLDGDDQLKDQYVLSYLNQVYADPEIWLTYGSYDFFPPRRGLIAGASAYPADVIAANTFRSHGFLATHLRTFYAGLFHKIKVTDLQDAEGQFWPVCWDLALMFPQLEMAGERHAFIAKVLYRYNTLNPIADNRVNLGLMSKFSGEFNSKVPYQRLAVRDW